MKQEKVAACLEELHWQFSRRGWTGQGQQKDSVLPALMFWHYLFLTLIIDAVSSSD
jgi:hypothetical protein